MTPAETKTNRQRQAAFRGRMRAAGYVQPRFWVHEDDKGRVLAYVERLNKAREKKALDTLRVME